MALKILLVDSDSAARQALRAMLAGFGHQVVGEVADGSDSVGLYSFRQLKPDLILLDIDLNFLDGLSALSQIRKIYPAARVIVVTSSNAPAEDIRSVGAVGLLRKPCHPDVVRNVLAQVETSQRPSQKTTLTPAPKAR